MSAVTFGFDPNQLYSVKELGGMKGVEKRGLLAMSYDSVMRKIVNNPRYGEWVFGKKIRRRRSSIMVLGAAVIQWLLDNRRSS